MPDLLIYIGSVILNVAALVILSVTAGGVKDPEHHPESHRRTTDREHRLFIIH